MMDIGGEFYVDGIQVAVYLTPGCITYTGITTNEMEGMYYWQYDLLHFVTIRKI